MYSKNLNEIWKIIKTITYKNRQSISIPNSFKNADETPIGEHDIADAFNNFFTNIGSNLSKQITPQCSSICDTLLDTNCNSMFLSETNVSEIITIVSKLTQKTSTDCNDMNMSLVKNIIHLVVQPFTYICHLSFATGIFPYAMKIAKIIPIYKTGAKDEFNNYRPISLLPQFSKILEKLFDDRLEQFICKNNILTDCQFGFRTGRSSSMAIVNLMEKITNSLDNKKTVISVFIDLRKAFDTIDHTIPLQKLNNYGIRGIVNQWVCSYLTHRKQYVQIKGTKSSLERIICGVLQGSILDPTLFNLYLNDICNVSSILEFTLFADDTSIIYSHDSTTSLCNTLNTELERLNAWFNLNKLSLNLQKTNYINFSTNNSDSTIQIAINGSNIEKVNSTKYLGVYIDHHLNWKDHIAYISSKLSKSTAVIHKTSHVLDTKTLTLLYNAIIFPYLNYCVEVWGNTYETNLYSLFIKQKKAIHIVCHAKYLDHTSWLFHKLKLLKSSDIVHFNACIFIYKAFDNLLPPSIQIYFSRSFSKKYYFNFHVHFARTQRKKFSISRIGVSFWNALDTKIKLSSSLSSFKIALKIALLIHISIINDLLTPFS